jgi:hypothetical protein
MIRRRRSGLHQEDIFPADIFLDLDECFAIRKRTHRAFAELNADRFADGISQRLIGCPAKYFHATVSSKQKTTQAVVPTKWARTLTPETFGARNFRHEPLSRTEP